MSRIMTLVLLAGLAWAVGCGRSSTELNTDPLTDEQKAKIRAEDQQTEQAERSGSGTATGKRKK
jgi:hypothetical protein